MEPGARATRRGPGGPPVAWRLALWFVMWLLRSVRGWRVQARPPDRVPHADQPLVVVFNHTSTVDAFVVAELVWRRLQHWVQPLVKAELHDAPVLGEVVRRAGAIPVRRTEGAGREVAYADAVATLREGGTILIAPEGTTTHDGSLLPLRHGAARLALQAGVDVLVVTHFGAQRGFSPVVRIPDRDAVVTVAVDLLSPLPDEDATTLTGRIAATMLDRSEELRATYPQADPHARWWPPYAVPASPTATAKENLERYRHAMAEAVAQARERMAQLADEHPIEQRVTQARERITRFAEDHEVEQRLTEAQDRAAAVAEDVAARSRVRAEQTRDRVDELTGQTRERFEELTGLTRQRFDELTGQTRERLDELTDQTRERFEQVSGQTREKLDGLSEQTRQRIEELAEQARGRANDLAAQVSTGDRRPTDDPTSGEVPREDDGTGADGRSDTGAGEGPDTGTDGVSDAAAADREPETGADGVGEDEPRR